MAGQRGSPFVIELLNKRRRRLTGAVFQAFEERPWYLALPRRERDEVREHILGAISVYHETILDILASSVSDGITNLSAVAKIDEIHDRVVTRASRSERPFTAAAEG